MLLGGMTGLAHAAKGKSSGYGVAPGIQDPMNPEAYLRDLAARMGTADKNLLLRGVDGSKAAPATTAKKAPVAPRNATPPASTPAAKPTAPTVPALGASNKPVPQAPQTQSVPSARPAATQDSTLQTLSPASHATGSLSQPAPLTGQAPTSAVEPAPEVPPSQPIGSPGSVPASVASPVPAERSPMPTLPAVPAAKAPAPANATAAAPSATPLMRLEPGMTLARPVQTVATPQTQTAVQTRTNSPITRGPGSVERELQVARTGLTLWNEPELAKQAAQEAARATPPQAKAPEPKEPWTLGGDLEKYRAHAVKDGSRNSGENLKKALERAGMAIGDSVNVFVLGYASDRAKPFRENDGKGVFQEPGKVPAQAGATIGSLGYALYSIVDLATFNALPDFKKPVYADNNVLVRPLLFTGRTIGGVWKTTEEVGNALTWGLFDNITGCLGLAIEDVVEFIKHVGEAVTNVARAPFHLAAGKKNHGGADQALDWVLLVPLELASNAVEMKGIANMHDYETAFADKGVIGSVLEFGGSTYIVYRAVDKVVDKCKKDKSSQTQSQSQNPTGQQGGSTTPTTPDTPPTPPKPPWPPVEPTPVSPDVEWYFTPDGKVIIE